MDRNPNMKTDIRFDHLDRAAALPVVSCLHNGTRFFLTESGVASDIPDRAKVFRHSHDATLAAIEARKEWQTVAMGSAMKWESGHLTPAGFASPNDERATLGGFYPQGWPSCPACGWPAMDGHITCGRLECNEGGRRP